MDTKHKMDDPRFIDEETIPLVQDKYYDGYKTSDISRIDETSFIEPDTTETTSTPRLGQKVKQNKIKAFYRHLNVTGDPDIANMDQFLVKKNLKTGNTDMLFLDGKSWQSLTNKGTGEFLVAKTLKEKFS